MGYINKEKLKELAAEMSNNSYGAYLLEILEEETENNAL